MSETTNVTMTDQKAMEEAVKFAKYFYNKGVKDTLRGVGIGAIIGMIGMIGVDVYKRLKDRKTNIKELES